jgi:hypothetical protein
MDGAKLTRLFLDAVGEEEALDQYADSRRIYEYLDWAAALFIRETGILHTSVTITTVADQQDYDLPPDYIRTYMKNRGGRYVAKYYDGSNYFWPVLTSHEKIYKANYTDSRTTPNRFAITDKADKEDMIEGAVTADGAAAGGECTLTDTTKAFTTTNKVYARDIVYNVTDGSDGYVLEVTSATELKVALFSGTANEWTSGDTYRIQPGSEYRLILEAPSESAGHTLELPYICMPSPVFSQYGWWRINPRSCRAIAWGGAAMFKQPEREFQDAAQLGGTFGAEVSRVKYEVAKQRLLENSRYKSVR